MDVLSRSTYRPDAPPVDQQHRHRGACEPARLKQPGIVITQERLAGGTS